MMFPLSHPSACIPLLYFGAAPRKPNDNLASPTPSLAASLLPPPFSIPFSPLLLPPLVPPAVCPLWNSAKSHPKIPGISCTALKGGQRRISWDKGLVQSHSWEPVDTVRRRGQPPSSRGHPGIALLHGGRCFVEAASWKPPSLPSGPALHLCPKPPAAPALPAGAPGAAAAVPPGWALLPGSPHCCSVVADAAPSCSPVTSSPCCPPSLRAVWGWDERKAFPLLPPSPRKTKGCALVFVSAPREAGGAVCSQPGSFPPAVPKLSFASPHCQPLPPRGKLHPTASPCGALGSTTCVCWLWCVPPNPLSPRICPDSHLKRS